jgi:hypothetical protein
LAAPLLGYANPLGYVAVLQWTMLKQRNENLLLNR